MKKIYSLIFFLFLSLLHFHISEALGQGNELTKDSISHLIKVNNYSSGDVLYEGDGIVLYAEEAIGYFDESCTFSSGPNFSKCVSFAIPADADYNQFFPFFPYGLRYDRGDGFSYYTLAYNFERAILRNSDCYPIEHSISLEDNEGNNIVAPYRVKPGKTYTLCVDVSLADEACSLVKFCMAPYLQKIDYEIEQYVYVKDEEKLIKKFPNNLNENFLSVCADGSDVSIFKVRAIDGNQQNLSNLDLRVKGDFSCATFGPASIQFGRFSRPYLMDDYVEFEYLHPNCVPSSTTKEYEEYELELFDKTNEDEVLQSVKFRVYRVPVVMVHGLNSNNTAFSKMKDELLLSRYYTSDFLDRANYKDTNKAKFKDNAHVLPKLIGDIINNLQEKRKIAVGKADVVGHSMGGILTRLYLQSEDYNDDIYRIITLNTPHSGTQLANIAGDKNLSSQLINLLPYGEDLQNPILTIFSLLEKGAVGDLQVDSDAILKDLNGITLNRNDVAYHSIITHYNLNLLDIPDNQLDFSLVPTQELGWFLVGVSLEIINDRIANINDFLEDLYDSKEHDMIVPALSQDGSEYNRGSSIIYNQHHSSTENPEVIEKVISLLRKSENDFDFANFGYDPYRLTYTPPVINSLSTEMEQFQTAEINIASPQDGTTVSTGSNVTVQVNGNSEIVEIFAMMSYDENETYFSRTQNSNFNFNFVADEKTGERTIVVLGKNASGQVITDKVTIFICSDDITFDNSEIQDGDYKVNNNIIANGYIEDGSDVNFRAGNSITLSAGFQTEEGINFSAKIESCSDNNPSTTNIAIDNNFNDWANVPTISTNGTTGLNSLKVHDDCEAIYVYINGNLDAHFQVFIDSDFNTTGANEFTRHYPNTGINFMIENAYPYDYTGTGDDWTWNQTSLDTEPFAKNGNQLEMKILKNIIPNLGANINVGLLTRDSDWNISGKLPDADAGAVYSLAVCNNFNKIQATRFNTVKNKGSKLEETISLEIFPNPFRETLNLALDVKATGNYSLVIYDILGKVAAQPLKNNWLEKGNHQMTINLNAANSFYVVQLSSNDGSFAQKIITQIRD